MPETIDAAALKEMNKTGENFRLYYRRSPFHMIWRSALKLQRQKDMTVQWLEDTDILLVPNITAGNILGKSLLFSGKGKDGRINSWGKGADSTYL